MTLTVFLLSLGAVARLTRLLTDDYITRHLRAGIIRWLGPDHDIAYLVACPWCLSLWVAGGGYTLAWFYGHTAAYTIAAAALSASWLYGVASTWLDTGSNGDDL